LTSHPGQEIAVLPAILVAWLLAALTDWLIGCAQRRSERG